MTIPPISPEVLIIFFLISFILGGITMARNINTAPSNNTQASVGGGIVGILIVLLLFPIIAYIFQYALSIPTTLSVRNEGYTNELFDDYYVAPKTTASKIDTLVNESPIKPKIDAFPHRPKKLFFIQVCRGGNKEAARKEAKKYEDLNSRVVQDNSEFIVVVGEGFETKDEAEEFKKEWQSILPEGAFIVELTVE